MIVIIESPFAGNVELNKKYLDAAILDCCLRGESPYASHKMLTDSLDDWNKEQRELGIKLGFEFHKVAKKVVVYTDLGISNGMKMGIKNAVELCIPVEKRSLGKKWIKLMDLN